MDSTFVSSDVAGNIRGRVAFLLSFWAVLGLCACDAAPTKDTAETPGPTFGESSAVKVDSTPFNRFGTIDKGLVVASPDVQLPVLALPDKSKSLSATSGFASDGSKMWYSQALTTSAGDVLVQGTRLSKGDEGAADKAATIDNPSIDLADDEVIGEARADFSLGNVAYTVVLSCAREQLSKCEDDTAIKQLVSSLALVGGVRQ